MAKEETHDLLLCLLPFDKNIVDRVLRILELCVVVEDSHGTCHPGNYN